MGKPSQRVVVAVRVSRAASDRVDMAAKAAGVGRSEMLRRMLTYSINLMPAGWTPEAAMRARTTPPDTGQLRASHG
jgi:hypothetical protein